jgi:hypothetical protein
VDVEDAFFKACRTEKDVSFAKSVLVSVITLARNRGANEPVIKRGSGVMSCLGGQYILGNGGQVKEKVEEETEINIPLLLELGGRHILAKPVPANVRVTELGEKVILARPVLVAVRVDLSLKKHILVDIEHRN